ncbi:MAG: leucine-rich repeat protein [Clostridia bacterium]|nr:leucine-rich repeat protein [Clostridia bacterium]
MKKTKFLSVVFLVVLFSAVFAFSAFGAEEEYVEGIFTYTVEDGKATIVKCVWETGDELVIPEELGGYPIVAIGDGAMQGDKYYIDEVIIPSSLERVGAKNYIFNATRFYVNCVEDWLDIEFSDNSFRKDPYFYIYVDGKLLKDLVIPEGITEIKPYAFNRCTTIETVTLPKGFKKIGNEAFTNSKVKKVYVDSFETWNSIDMRDIPMKVAKELYIGGELVTAIDVPESVTELNSKNFLYIKNLEYLKLHENVSAVYGGISVESLYIDSMEQYIDIIANSVSESDAATSPVSFMSCAEKVYIGGELLTEIVIPEGVKEIPAGCFSATKGISKISFPSSVEKIGKNAFFNMPDTKAVYVADAETWFRICDELAVSSGYKVFDKLYIGGEEAVTVTIPDSVEKLPFWSFSRVKNVKSIVLSKNIKEFNKAFSNDCSYIENVYVDSLETWLGYNFETASCNPMCWAEKLYVDGELLTDVIYPDGTTEIGLEFYDCESLKTVAIPASVTTVKKDAFMGCESLEAVYAESLESWLNIDFETPESNPLYYGAKLYIDGKLLTEVTLPESMSEFKSYTFYNCTSLEKINITENVKAFGKNTFIYCTADVYADTLEHWLSFDFKDGKSPMIYGKDLYIAGEPLTELIIPESVEIIPSYAFAYVKNLTRVEIPASTKIYDSAFRNSGVKVAEVGTLPKGQTQATAEINQYNSWFTGCSDIELIIGPGIRKIGYQAFSGCVAIKKITFSYAVEVIGEQAFKGSCHLKEVVISSSVKSVGEYAFSECHMLESVTFGDKTEGKAVTDVGYRAFYKCPALKNITFNTGVKSFDGYAFQESKNIENVYVNDLASYLGITHKEMHDNWSSPAYFADNLYINGEVAKNLVIPEGVTRISEYAFYGTKTLETVQFPSTLTHIGDCSFALCVNLQDVVFPDSLKKIGDFSFMTCKKIKSLEIPRNVKSIGISAFDFCSSLEYVVFYEKIGTAGDHAFKDCKNLKQILYTGTESQWMTFVTKNYNSGVANVPYYCEYDPDALFSPKNLSATQTSSSITVKWSAVNGATGYRVFVKNTQTGKWDIAVRTTGKKTTATISNLNSGSKYCVAVKAYMNTGALIMWSPEYSELITITRPAVADKVTASQKTESITLKWNKVPGATGYRIYVARNGSWKALKTTTKLTYTIRDLNPGTKYTFAVKAYTKHDGNTYWASKYARLETATKTATPVATVTSTSKTKSLVKWNNVSGESGYQVWYSTSKDGTYKRFGNAKANATSMMVTGLTSAKTYYFKVRTYIKTDSGYVYSAWSAVKSVKVK